MLFSVYLRLAYCFLDVVWGLFGVGLGICDWFQVDFGFAYNLFKVCLGFV